MGSVIPALVIVSISVMMVVSILPVYAHPPPGTPIGTCPTNWSIMHLEPGEDHPKDKNGNEHLCKKMTDNEKIILKDDHISGKNKI